MVEHLIDSLIFNLFNDKKNLVIDRCLILLFIISELLIVTNIYLINLN